MYSKAKIFGHPIHPMLVGFPVAFYTTTLVAFIAYAMNHNLFWFRVGVTANAAGVGTALLAAVPGLIDWAMGIPSGTIAKRVGRYHMVLNVSALLLFSLNLFFQAGNWNFPPASVADAIVLSVAGMVLTLTAGYLGWTMVQTFHVGIDGAPDSEREFLEHAFKEEERRRSA